MRNTVFALLAAFALALTVSSPADAGHKRHKILHNKPVVIGAVVGTVVGIGLYEGWISGATAASFSSVGAAATGGLVAGVATATLIHAATTKCQGFHALFGGKGCKGGKYVGR